ncbi:hypothetical protein FRB96_000591 [Tulasnella sp. 330]|nr:hypothetical protein FRB96_000591 [Tulasnella sp. 330]
MAVSCVDIRAVRAWARVATKQRDLNLLPTNPVLDILSTPTMAREVTELSSLPSPTRTTRLQTRLQYERPNIFPSSNSGHNRNLDEPLPSPIAAPEDSPFNLKISSETFLLDANESFDEHMHGMDRLSDTTATESPAETLEGLRVSPRKNKGKSKAERPADEPASPVRFVFRAMKGRAPAAPPLVLTSPTQRALTLATTLEPDQSLNANEASSRVAYPRITPQGEADSDSEESRVSAPTTPLPSNPSFHKAVFPSLEQGHPVHQLANRAKGEYCQPSQTLPAHSTSREDVANRFEEPTMMGAGTRAPNQVMASTGGGALTAQSAPIPEPSPLSKPEGKSQDLPPSLKSSTSTDQGTMNLAKQEQPRKFIQLRPHKSQVGTKSEQTPSTSTSDLAATSSSITTYTVALRAPGAATTDPTTSVSSLRRSRSSKRRTVQQPMEAESSLDEAAEVGEAQGDIDPPVTAKTPPEPQVTTQSTTTHRKEQLPTQVRRSRPSRKQATPQVKEVVSPEPADTSRSPKSEESVIPISSTAPIPEEEEPPVFDDEVITEAREAVSTQSLEMKKTNRGLTAADAWVKLKDEDLATRASSIAPSDSPGTNGNPEAGPSRQRASDERAANENEADDAKEQEQAQAVEVVPPPRVTAHVPKGKAIRIISSSITRATVPSAPALSTSKRNRTAVAANPTRPSKKLQDNNDNADIPTPVIISATANPAAVVLKRSRTVASGVEPARDQQREQTDNNDDGIKISKRIKITVALESSKTAKTTIGPRRVVSGTTASSRRAPISGSNGEGSRRVVSERQTRDRWPLKAAVPVQQRPVSNPKAQDKDKQQAQSTVPHAFTFQSDRRLELKKEKGRAKDDVENHAPAPIVFKPVHHPVNLSRPTQASLTRALATVDSSTTNAPPHHPLKPSTLNHLTSYQPTVPQSPKLATAMRLQERGPFEDTMRRKEEERREAGEERRKEEERRKDEEVKALRKLLDETAKANVHEPPEWYKDRPHLVGGRKGLA